MSIKSLRFQKIVKIIYFRGLMALTYTTKFFDNPVSVALNNQLEQILARHQFVKKEVGFEYLFIIGGDGTFLNFVTPYLDKDVKVIMINSGNIGFFSSCTIDELEQVLDCQTCYQKLHVLSVEIDQQKYCCLNEVTTFSFNALPIEMALNDKPWYQFYGSGFLVASPLGSSGSNKSNYGPLVDPDLNCYIVSEILAVNNNRFSSFNAPIVIKDDKTLTITWSPEKQLQVAIDNKIIAYHEPKIIIKGRQSQAKLLMLKPVMFDKWNESFRK